MAKIIDFDLHLLEDMTPAQAETLLGGYCQFLQVHPDIYMSNLAENMNNAKKQTGGVDNKYRNQKINSIDNSKKTYVNGVLIPSNGKAVFIHGFSS